ncbi:alcohol dehydrogenase catalytic domain-containing protein [Modestobacter lapidis]|nr:alcohol dehydrogenase catalytic domain-containing protein [Modestobacter lapidis]
MRAAVTQGLGSVLLEDRPGPGGPVAGETVVRVEAVGICGSDLHLLHGDLGATHEGLLPRVQGHEFSAVVAAADPAGSGPPVGTRVAVWPVLACGTCRPCREGRVNVCRRLALIGVHRDGALQEQLTVPTAAAVATPTLSSVQAALVEPVSIGVHAAARARVSPGDTVVVFGAGPIGAASALAARDRGGDVLVVDPVDARRDLLARAGFGVTWAEGAELAGQVLAHSGPDGPDVVLDTTGRAALLPTVLDVAGHGGRVAVVGLTSATAPTSPGPIPFKELDVLGVSCCTRDEFAAAADLVARHPALADSLVSHVFPLDEVAGALALLDERPTEAVKVLVDVSGDTRLPTGPGAGDPMTGAFR